MRKFNFYSFAIGLVFFVFGIWQWVQPNYWLDYLPQFVKNFDQNLLIKLNGTFDIIVGLALILNFYPLIFSLLAVLHLLGIILNIGIFNEIAIRDLGLLLVALGIFIEELKKKKQH